MVPSLPSREVYPDSGDATRLDWQRRVVAPFLPRAVVDADVRSAEEMQDEGAECGADPGVAVGDDGCGRRGAPGLEEGADLLGGMQAPVRVERLAPLQVTRAGYATAAGRSDLLARELCLAADVEDDRRFAAHDIEHVFLPRKELRTRTRREPSLMNGRVARLERQPCGSPGLQAAVQDSDGVVAVVAERPPEARGVMAALEV